MVTLPRKITAFFPPLISIMIVFMIFLESTIINARELRPSDHGLEYYYDPGESPEMTSFFGPPSTSSTSLTSPSSSTLPSAVKSPMTTSSDDDTWRRSNKGRGDDHVMSHVLILGSLVCGVTGVAFMIASALIYFLGNGKKRNSSDDCDDNNNK